MKAEIITSGTELLLGEITDTNSPYLAGQLARLGIDLYFISTVGDNFGRFSGVLRQAWERSDLIIITGGIGPTQGDITRNVVAGLLGEILYVDAGLKEEVSAIFKRRGMEMPQNNIKQAMLVPSAKALHNLAGTAPGWWVEKGGKIIITLPGPPAEMQEMWQKQVLPRLEASSGSIILSRTLKTWGLSEGKVDELVSPYLGTGNPTLALYARVDGISLRVTAKASTEAGARELVLAREREIRAILGKHIWGVDNETLEEIVGRMLAVRKQTLAISESFTGWLLAYAFAANPASQGHFKGGVIVPANAAMVAETSAVEKASGVRSRFGADIGMAIDGCCEDAASAMKGRAFVAIDAPTGSRAISLNYPGRPPQVIRRTINHALVYLLNFLE
ncbi:MAG: hypothetical protein A2137_05340 [Chloroflexi bacterium RBG_16_58_8]|nr:MAG: hypothetical protein A2137_05340 [Chloroflexi bacterium RBG_16_58_8]